MKIRNLVLTNRPANERHPQLGLPSVGKGGRRAGMHPLLHVAVWFTFAAPFAAMLCRKISARTLLVLVGILIIILSFFICIAR